MPLKLMVPIGCVTSLELYVFGMKRGDDRREEADTAGRGREAEGREERKRFNFFVGEICCSIATRSATVWMPCYCRSRPSPCSCWSNKVNYSHSPLFSPSPLQISLLILILDNLSLACYLLCPPYCQPYLHFCFVFCFLFFVFCFLFFDIVQICRKEPETRRMLLTACTLGDIGYPISWEYVFPKNSNPKVPPSLPSPLPHSLLSPLVLLISFYRWYTTCPHFRGRANTTGTSPWSPRCAGERVEKERVKRRNKNIERADKT
jgi:hypothetical protein